MQPASQLGIETSTKKPQVLTTLTNTDESDELFNSISHLVPLKGHTHQCPSKLPIQHQINASKQEFKKPTCIIERPEGQGEIYLKFLRFKNNYNKPNKQVKQD